jgi:hypothetical protein
MKLPKSVSNWISITGFVFAVNSLILIVVLFIQALLTAHPNPYNGIFTFIILPIILVIGLLMIPIGMLINRKKTHDPEKRWPVLDMNAPRQRQKFILISIFTFLFLIVSAMGSMKRLITRNPLNSAENYVIK